MSLAGDVAEGAVRKLPLWDTICLSYSTFFCNFRDVLLICWLWLIVLAPLMTLENAMQWSLMAKTLADLKQTPLPQRSAVSVSMPIDLRILIYGVGLLFMAAGVSIAVAWHRRIILGEQPRLSISNVGTGSFWRYAGVGLAIVFIAFAPIVLCLLVLGLFLFPFISHAAPGAVKLGSAVPFILIGLLLYLTGIAVILRLCLLLPARAVGDLGVTFKRAWNRTRGNTWRIFWGILACTLPPILIIEIVTLVLVGFPRPQNFATGSLPVPVLIISAIFTVCYLLTLPIWIGFLSLSYLHFFERHPGSDSTVPAQLQAH